MLTVMAFDYGNNGGVAILEGDEVIIAEPLPLVSTNFPDVNQLQEWCIGNNVDVVALEGLVKKSQRGASSKAAAWGMLYAFATMMDVELVVVPPKEWQAWIMAEVGADEWDKAVGMEYCASRGFQVPYALRKDGTPRMEKGEPKVHDGVSDAYCIASYTMAATNG